jgi:hypothetical protein
MERMEYLQLWIAALCKTVDALESYYSMHCKQIRLKKEDVRSSLENNIKVDPPDCSITVVASCRASTKKVG